MKEMFVCLKNSNLDCIVIPNASSRLQFPSIKDISLKQQKLSKTDMCPSSLFSICPEKQYTVRLSVCPFVGLSVITSVGLSVCRSVRLSVCPSVGL